MKWDERTNPSLSYKRRASRNQLYEYMIEMRFQVYPPSLFLSFYITTTNHPFQQYSYPIPTTYIIYLYSPINRS